MAEMTVEEKYKRKAALLKKALADADRMDAAVRKKTATAKTKQKQEKTDQKDQQAKEDEAAATPMPLDF
ncbi:MAG: hypothetical protein HXX11_13915 [Desulfuromonadales bacterium]|nr:hypothetical protein [Desulfuromonadales bacterium]